MYNSDQQDIRTFNASDVKRIPQKFTAVVVSIDIQKAVDLYAEPANLEDKIVVVKYENAEYGHIGEEHFKFYPREDLTERQKLGKLLIKYNNITEGTKVEVEKGENGFFNIVV